MRILIVTGDFGGGKRNPWLLDDLAIAFSDAGDEVDVLVHDAKHPRKHGWNAYPDRRIRLYSVGPTRIRPGRLGKIVNYLAAAWGLQVRGSRLARDAAYDLCVYTSIGVFSWGLPSRLRHTGAVKRSVFVLWDFFPIHQLEIGRLSCWILHAPLRTLEALSMSGADAIAVMSPANEHFLRQYHPRIHARTIIVPPWASDPFTDSANRVPQRKHFTVVFGGQLEVGRGLDTLLLAVGRLQSEGVLLDLLIVGDGSARTDLVRLADRIGLTNVTFVTTLPRDEYRRLLQSAHVGVAITVAGVTPPTFPSKIVEYCASGIPVLVCVEPASDAGTFVESAGAGFSVPAGDVPRLASAIAALYEEHRHGTLASRGHKARALFESRLSVSRAASTIRAVAIPS